MPHAVPRDVIYRRRRFSADIIELCVRWYITYRLSYRDLAEMMAERGVYVTHTTIMRWVLRYVPEYEKRWARFAMPVGSSWRMDETSVSVRGGRGYLYRAVDRDGKSVDSLLCRERTMESARAFLRKAIATEGVGWPSKINLDGYTASHRAVRLLGEEDDRWRRVAVRDRRYLNNIVEQDHRAIKQRCASMLGFKSFDTAAVTLSGIELAHRIRKWQFWVSSDQIPGLGRYPSLKKLWDRALTGEAVPRGPQSAVFPLMHRNSSVRRVSSDSPRRYPKKVFIGGSLYLYLAPSGGKYWRYKYHYGGKEKLLSLGTFPEVPAESAKLRHLAARQLLAAGVDPGLRKDQVRQGSVIQ